MKEYPLITIIIPTHNRCEWLERSIKYAFIHDYPNFEVVVSNNASTDNTIELLTDLKFKYSNLRIVNHKEVLPLNIHWDTVIKEYTLGKYIMVIPDDDIIIDSKYLSKAVRLFQRYSTVGIVFGNYRNINLKGEVIQEIRANFNEFIKNDFMFENFNKELFGIKGIGIPHLTAVFSKDAYDKVNGFDFNCLSPDVYLWLKIMLYFDLAFCNNIVANYTIHKGNLSTTALPIGRYYDTLIPKKVKEISKDSKIDKSIINYTLRRMQFKFLKSYCRASLKFIKNNGINNIFRIKIKAFIKYFFLLFFKH